MATRRTIPRANISKRSKVPNVVNIIIDLLNRNYNKKINTYFCLSFDFTEIY